MSPARDESRATQPAAHSPQFPPRRQPRPARPRMRSPASRVSFHEADGVEILGPQYEIERKANSDREHEQAEEQPQAFASHLLPGAGAELRAGDTAYHQDQGEQRIHEMIC